jgi:hypothetical protein
VTLLLGNTAIVTYYLVGSVVTAGVTTSGPWRVTEVWVRDGNTVEGSAPSLRLSFREKLEVLE